MQVLGKPAPAKWRMDELYDLEADPYEMKNLIDDPGSKEELERSGAELTRLLEETDGEMR